MPKSLATNRHPCFVGVLLSLAASGLLAGCSTVETVQSFLPRGDPNAATMALGANPPKTAHPGANASEKPIVRPVASIDINCPPVDVAEDGAAYRVGGADNESVRYQFNIGDTARQCDPAGPGQASIKIGVKGEVVIGPAGSPGTYSVPLRIVVTGADKKEVFSKTYKVEATTNGFSVGSFEVVTEPIVVPMPTLQLADVYSISVGFQAVAPVAAPHRHRRHPTG
jgi:hypothetical protein